MISITTTHSSNSDIQKIKDKSIPSSPCHDNNTSQDPNVNPNHPHDPNPTQDTIITIQAIRESHTYQIRSSTFIHCDLLQEITTPSTSYPPQNGLTSCFQNNKYCIRKIIFEKMNYQGNGLGLHEQGILEPLKLIENERSYGLS